MFVIETAVAMLVSAHSSNHEPYQEADRDPKRLSNMTHSFVNRPFVFSFQFNFVQAFNFIIFRAKNIHLRYVQNDV